MERYWTRVNEVDDDLLDLWNVRYVVEPKGGLPRSQAQGISFDPAQPLVDGPAGSPLGDERFRIAPTPADMVRLLGSLSGGEQIANGEPVAEVTLSGPDFGPLTLMVRAGEHLSEAAYDAGPERIAHRKVNVGMRWEPRDPSGRVYPRDIYVADLALPQTARIDQVSVRTVARKGALRLSGLGLYDRGGNMVRSVLASHRAKYSVAYDGDTTVIYENREAQPRAFLVPRALGVPADDWSIVRLTDDALNPRTTVLLERPAAEQATVVLDGAPLAPDESAEIVRYEPDRAVVRVHAQETRYLVLADSYFSGWTASVDGQPAAVERASYLFRAVQVPPGEHLVEWRYQPLSLLYGGLVTGGALAVMLVLAARGLSTKGRAPAQAQPVSRLPQPG
jgi:hypothetical protein